MNKETVLAEIAEIADMARNSGRNMLADRLVALGTLVDENLVEMEPAY